MSNDIKKNKKLSIEFYLFLFTSMLLILFFILVLVLFFLPISNYHHSDGVVEYKYQYKLVSQVEGVISDVFVSNNAKVSKGSPIFQYSSDKNIQEASYLNIRLEHLFNEKAVLNKLYKIGSITKEKINLKNLEINELKKQIEFLNINEICAPLEGKVHFFIHPKYIRGTYIYEGQVLALIYTNNEKIVRITFPNYYADRFKIGSKVLIKYKDPASFKIHKLKGVIYNKFTNVEESTVDLFCEITENKDKLKTLDPSTSVNSSVLINSTSIAEDLFNFKSGFTKYIHEKFNN